MCDITYHDYRELHFVDEFKHIIEAVARLIFDRKLSANQIELSLYRLIAQELWSGFKQGYKNFDRITFDMPDNAFVARIQSNIFAFSGAKTYAEMQILRDAIIKDGAVVPWTQFRSFALSVNQMYNEFHLATERNHVIRAGTLGSRWQQIEKDKELFPYLKYETVGDERVRDEHRSLEGMTLSVDSGFWDRYYPPNGWNCRCSVKQIFQPDEDGLIDLEDANAIASVNIEDEYFKGNVGKSAIVFKGSHPYFKSVPSGKPINLQAVKHYGLPKLSRIYADSSKLPILPENDVIDEIVQDKRGLFIKLRDSVSVDMITKPDEIYRSPTGQLTYIKYYDKGPKRVLIASDMKSSKPVEATEIHREGILEYKK